MQLWNWLLTIPHPDPETQRRGQNLIIVGLGLAAMSVVAIPLVLIQPDPLPQLIANLIGLGLLIGVLGIARFGLIDQAASAMIALLVISSAIIPFGTGQIGLVPIFALVAVITATDRARTSRCFCSCVRDCRHDRAVVWGVRPTTSGAIGGRNCHCWHTSLAGLWINWRHWHSQRAAGNRTGTTGSISG